MSVFCLRPTVSLLVVVTFSRGVGKEFRIRESRKGSDSDLLSLVGVCVVFGPRLIVAHRQIGTLPTFSPLSLGGTPK